MACSRCGCDSKILSYTCEICKREELSGAVDFEYYECKRTVDEITAKKRDIETKCKKKVDEITAEFELYQLKLTFLRLLPLDGEPADELRKGDVVLVVQGESDATLHAHKFVLSTRSTVFSKMFQTEMLERETGVVHIDDATLPVMRAVIKFCYNADITFTTEVTGEDVLVVAHKYVITLLHKMCEEHLIKTLNNHNLPKRLRLAKKFDAPRLERAATEYLKNNFDSVISDVLTELC